MTQLSPRPRTPAAVLGVLLLALALVAAAFAPAHAGGRGHDDGPDPVATQYTNP